MTYLELESYCNANPKEDDAPEDSIVKLIAQSKPSDKLSLLQLAEFHNIVSELTFTGTLTSKPLDIQLNTMVKTQREADVPIETLPQASDPRSWKLKYYNEGTDVFTVVQVLALTWKKLVRKCVAHCQTVATQHAILKTLQVAQDLALEGYSTLMAIADLWPHLHHKGTFACWFSHSWSSLEDMSPVLKIPVFHVVRKAKYKGEVKIAIKHSTSCPMDAATPLGVCLIAASLGAPRTKCNINTHCSTTRTTHDMQHKLSLQLGAGTMVSTSRSSW
jgi:hypothetical protein